MTRTISISRTGWIWPTAFTRHRLEVVTDNGDVDTLGPATVFEVVTDNGDVDTLGQATVFLYLLIRACKSAVPQIDYA